MILVVEDSESDVQVTVESLHMNAAMAAKKGVMKVFEQHLPKFLGNKIFKGGVILSITYRDMTQDVHKDLTLAFSEYRGRVRNDWRRGRWILTCIPIQTQCTYCLYVCSRSVEGLTPVHVAAAWGKVSILYLLLVNGGDPWLLDEDRNNAFHYALQERHWDVLQLLHRFRLRDKLSDDSVKYTITLNKIILTRGDTCLEYGTTPEPLGNTSYVERHISSTIGVKEYYEEPYTILCEDKHLTKVTKEHETLDNQNPTDQYQNVFFPELLNEITSVCKSREIGNIVNNSDITNDAVQVTSDNNLVVCSGYKTNQSDDILVDSLHIDSSDVRQTQSNLCDIVTPSLLAVEDTFLSSMDGDYATCNEYDSLSKEYIYLDQEEGIALLERILPVKSLWTVHTHPCHYPVDWFGCWTFPLIKENCPSELEVLPPCPVLSDVPSWCLTDPSQGPAVIWPGY
uniref:Uncharacterized protein n=1 Tax=Timema bartmani TaxID=61472 RepID=A0A7R9I5B9_9NEOP|nr:unnamed protein product [Timema bartmani]